MSGLKKVSSKPSIFDSMPKKPTTQQFEEAVKDTQERLTGHKQVAAEITTRFEQIMSDKTLQTNKNMLTNDIEIETLKDMMKFANEVNNDPSEDEGIGSLGLIAIILKTFILQRNKINNLEYQVSLLEKKLSTMVTKLVDDKQTNG